MSLDNCVVGYLGDAVAAGGWEDKSRKLRDACSRLSTILTSDMDTFQLWSNTSRAEYQRWRWIWCKMWNDHWRHDLQKHLWFHSEDWWLHASILQSLEFVSQFRVWYYETPGVYLTCEIGKYWWPNHHHILTHVHWSLVQPGLSLSHSTTLI
jgi:hypothetical protein